MTEQLESKLTARSTYKMARQTGFGKLNSAYLALPVAIENFAKTTKEIMTPTVQSIQVDEKARTYQVDEKARTYHIVEENATFGNHIAEFYANILEFKGYKRI